MFASKISLWFEKSPKKWNKRFDSFVVKIWFKQSQYDTCVYYREGQGGQLHYLLLYVDDILLIGAFK